MTNVGGRKFSYTLTGQTPGATINYAAKFAFAGGMSVTRYIPYVVGSECATSLSPKTKLDFSLFPNPTDGKIHFTGMENKFYTYSIVDVTGRKLKAGILPSSATTLDLSEFDNGVYILNLNSETSRLHRKLVVRK